MEIFDHIFYFFNINVFLNMESKEVVNCILIIKKKLSIIDQVEVKSNMRV